MRRSILLGASLLVLLLSAGAADGAVVGRSGGGLLHSPLLWATVDACSSSSTGDLVGLRASMPGTGHKGEHMYMRFRLQYRGAKGVWHYVGGADSGFVHAGSARYVSRQTGRNFNLAASTAPGTVLRGVVIFDWRIAGQDVHHAQLQTTAGRRVGAGASPPGYSAARCKLS